MPKPPPRERIPRQKAPGGPEYAVAQTPPISVEARLLGQLFARRTTSEAPRDIVLAGPEFAVLFPEGDEDPPKRISAWERLSSDDDT